MKLLLIGAWGYGVGLCCQKLYSYDITVVEGLSGQGFKGAKESITLV